MAKICKPNRETRIYTLSHPITKEIRYIGKTVNSLKKRLSDHIYDVKRSKNHKNNWVISILKLNLKPAIIEIDSCPWIKSQELEKYYINKYKQEGFRLVNHSLGGEGFTGNLKEEHKQKIRKALRKSTGKKTYQYSLKGTLIYIFNSVADCSDMGFNKSHVVACCKKKRVSHKGFLWSYTILSSKDIAEMINKIKANPYSKKLYGY